MKKLPKRAQNYVIKDASKLPPIKGAQPSIQTETPTPRRASDPPKSSADANTESRSVSRRRSASEPPGTRPSFWTRNPWGVKQESEHVPTPPNTPRTLAAKEFCRTYG